MTTLSIEKENVRVLPDYSSLCEQVAGRIADVVRAKPNAVLGLATGSSPLGVYDALARMHREDALDFSRVTCFNLDEYYPMQPDSPRSYHWFMEMNLFKHINCGRWHVPDGAPRTLEEIDQDCRLYEAAIDIAGGVDLQLLGIGRTGHIGFNEPGSARDSRTRLVTLHDVTRQDAVKDFGCIDAVPTQAVTMGIGTILESRQIVLMASGAGKAEIVREMLAGNIDAHVPATLLRNHSNVGIYIDQAAAAKI
jgi:glucosamine-6-phosphate deaminase